MHKLLWAECLKLRRSKIIWIAVFATVMVAFFVFIEGWFMHDDIRYIDTVGWYMTTAQTMATFLVLPAVIALLGSYMICREEQEDTIKSLQIIPINEAKLTFAKMVMTFTFSIFIYLLLFAISFLCEAVLHLDGLSSGMVTSFLKIYFLQGVGVFLAISPIIALAAYRKNGYWLAMVLTEAYSFAGIFMSMSSTAKTFYPITAVFGFSGYTDASIESRVGSTIVLLLCGCLSAAFLFRLKNRIES